MQRKDRAWILDPILVERLAGQHVLGLSGFRILMYQYQLLLLLLLLLLLRKLSCELPCSNSTSRKFYSQFLDFALEVDLIYFLFFSLKWALFFVPTCPNELCLSIGVIVPMKFCQLVSWDTWSLVPLSLNIVNYAIWFKNFSNVSSWLKHKSTHKLKAR